MSGFVYGSMPYKTYLQAKSFVDDIIAGERRVAFQIPHRTRQFLVSDTALAELQMQISTAQSNQSAQALSAVSERISFELQNVASKIADLKATFEWGFAEMIAEIGHMSDDISELVRIAKTRIQTDAYNHFEIARKAFRMGLYSDALEEANKAIHGDHVSSGYKLGWQFYHFIGTIRLGFADCDFGLVDLADAENQFLVAAKYARLDFPKEAALAMLSAGWAAYCQGYLANALEYTQNAITLNSKLGEAYFQAAKINMAQGKCAEGLRMLERAIEIDCVYSLRVVVDGDFTKHPKEVSAYLLDLRHRVCQALVARAKTIIIEIEKELGGSVTNTANPGYLRMRTLIDAAPKTPLIDLIKLSPTLDGIRDEMYRSGYDLINGIIREEIYRSGYFPLRYEFRLVPPGPGVGQSYLVSMFGLGLNDGIIHFGDFAEIKYWLRMANEKTTNAPYRCPTRAELVNVHKLGFMEKHNDLRSFWCADGKAYYPNGACRETDEYGRELRTSHLLMVRNVV